jgi:hypothetical protein
MNLFPFTEKEERERKKRKKGRDEGRREKGREGGREGGSFLLNIKVLRHGFT